MDIDAEAKKFGKIFRDYIAEVDEEIIIEETEE
jgi:hypothetical protein